MGFGWDNIGFLVFYSEYLHVIKAIWKDSVFSGILVALITTGGIGTYFLNLWPLIGKFLVHIYNFLCASSSVSNWVIGLGLICSILFILLLGIIIWEGIFSSNKSVSEPWHSYTEDNIYGAKWRWHWDGNSIGNIWCYCPNCDATLVYDDSSCRDLYSQSKTNFICENCGNKVVATVSGGNKDYATGAAIREAHRRLRTNEYKKHQ